MADLLLTQLKATVNDPNLRKIGEILLRVHSTDDPDYTSTQRITISSSVAQTLKCLDGGTFVDSSGVPTSTEFAVTTTPNRIAMCGNGNYCVSVPNKTAITLLRAQSQIGININDLDGCPNLADLGADNPYCSGNLLSLKNTIVAQCVLSKAQITGTLADLPSTITSLYTNACGLIDDIANAGHLVNMGTFETPNNPQLTGNLEDFAQALFDNGKTSGSLTVNITNCNVRFLDAVFSGRKTITFSNSGYSIS